MKNLFTNARSLRTVLAVGATLLALPFTSALSSAQAAPTYYRRVVTRSYHHRYRRPVVVTRTYRRPYRRSYTTTRTYRRPYTSTRRTTTYRRTYRHY